MDAEEGYPCPPGQELRERINHVGRGQVEGVDDLEVDLAVGALLVLADEAGAQDVLADVLTGGGELDALPGDHQLLAGDLDGVGGLLDVRRLEGSGLLQHVNPGLQAGEGPGGGAAQIVAGLGLVHGVDLGGDGLHLAHLGDEHGAGQDADRGVPQRVHELRHLKPGVLAPQNLGLGFLVLERFHHENGVRAVGGEQHGIGLHGGQGANLAGKVGGLGAVEDRFLELESVLLGELLDQFGDGGAPFGLLAGRGQVRDVFLGHGGHSLHLALGHALQKLEEILGKVVVVRGRAPEPLVALAGQVRRRRGVVDQRHPVLFGDTADGLGHRTVIGAHEPVDLVVEDELFGEVGSQGGVAFVVLEDESDLGPAQALDAGILGHGHVEVRHDVVGDVGGKFGPRTKLPAGRSRTAGEGEENPDLDLVRGKQGARQKQRCDQDGYRQPPQ